MMNKYNLITVKNHNVELNFNNYTIFKNHNYENLFLQIAKITKAVLGILTNWEVNVSFVNPNMAQKYNVQYRHKKYIPDVLAFPLKISDKLAAALKSNVLGDIVLCPEQIKKQSISKKSSFSKEIALMFAHGLLHILGYDHLTTADYNTMHNLEALILRNMELELKNYE